MKTFQISLGYLYRIHLGTTLAPQVHMTVICRAEDRPFTYPWTVSWDLSLKTPHLRGEAHQESRTKGT